MKPMFIVMLLFVGGLISTFGIDNEESIAPDNQPVITGGWYEIAELDEAITSFVDDYLKDNLDAFTTYAAHQEIAWIVERAWSQLVHGRRYLLAFYIMPMLQETDEDNSLADAVPPALGLLMLRRDLSGTITLEKSYSHFALFDFIELMLTGGKL